MTITVYRGEQLNDGHDREFRILRPRDDFRRRVRLASGIDGRRVRGILPVLVLLTPSYWRARTGIKSMQSLSRTMNFSTVTLTVTKEEARARIAERISGVRTRKSNGRYEFTSPVGFRLAELSDASLPSGEQGSQLKYRTAIISPVVAPARSKALEIKNAVAKYRY